jgi:hypothetical protein
MVRRSASFDADDARRQLLEEWQEPGGASVVGAQAHSLERPHRGPGDRLGDIETDRCDRLHAWLRRIVVTSTATMALALTCRWRSGPQHH